MSKEANFQFFRLETGEVFSFYNGKQVTLGLLVKPHFNNNSETTSDFDIIEPVVVHIDSMFNITKNPITGEFYNALDLRITPKGVKNVSSNIVTRNLGKYLFGASEELGVISYRMYYGDELRKEVEDRLGVDYQTLTAQEYVAAVDGVIFDKIKNIVGSARKKENK